MNCPSCGAPVEEGDRFCEACGAGVPAGPAPSVATAAAAVTTPAGGTCVTCGAPVGADGYCQQCGLKQPDPHDHEEIDLGWVAGVTDRGLHHPLNEDAMFVAAPRPGLAVAVVCDGVSSSSNAQAAAMAAATAAGAVLLDGVGGDTRAALIDAAAAAQQSVLATPPIGDGEPPSCTFVAAAFRDGELTVGWVGDSRAYWLGSGGNQRLTSDDSWAAEQVAAGALTEEQAEADARSHSITGWLGRDAPDPTPRTVHLRPLGGGCVVVCSDGLWNYASSADGLASLLPGRPAIDTARHLADYALQSGGHDNVTVVVLEGDR